MVVIERDLKKEYKQMMEDNVNNPSHYNQKNIEAIRAIEASMDAEEFQGYLKGNTLKYIWRYRYKTHPVEDLEKAQYYLNLLIKRVKEHYGSTSKVP
jgi:hypothetical protein